LDLQKYGNQIEWYVYGTSEVWSMYSKRMVEVQ